MKHWAFVVYQLISLTQFLRGEVTIDNDGAYRGLVVAISSDVPEKNGPAVISGIKEMFTEGSEVLFNAVRGMAYFANISILVPATWTTVGPAGPAVWENYQEADIQVARPSSRYGSNPHTEQPFGCGQPGLRINIPADYLVGLNDTSSRQKGEWGKVLVQQWAHYRYGVYDEVGYPHNSRYPQFYYKNSKIVPTSCTDRDLEGTLSANSGEPRIPCPYSNRTALPQGSCRFLPRRHNTSATTSLMSYTDLPSVAHFCDASNHQQEAPTPQNVLCEGRSIWDVISSHRDFDGRSNETRPSKVNTSPFFNVIQQKGQFNYVVVIGLSQEQYDTVQVRLSLLAWIGYRIHSGSSVTVVSKCGSKVIQRTLITSKESRRRLEQSLPVHLGDGGAECTWCSFLRGLEISSQEVGRNVLILLAGDLISDNSTCGNKSQPTHDRTRKGVKEALRSTHEPTSTDGPSEWTSSDAHPSKRASFLSPGTASFKSRSAVAKSSSPVSVVTTASTPEGSYGNHSLVTANGTASTSTPAEETLSSISTPEDARKTMDEKEIKTLVISFKPQLTKEERTVFRNVKTFHVSGRRSKSMLVEALDATLLYQQADGTGNHLVKLLEAEYSGPGTTFTYKIYVDESSRRNLLVWVAHASRNETDALQLLNPADGTVRHFDYDPVARLAHTEILDAVVGEWTVKGSLDSSSNTSVLITAIAEPSSNSPNGLRATCWIDKAVIGQDVYVRVFSKVTQGYEPVIDARVRAELEQPSGSMVELDLQDSGTGADQVQGDGIYSRYLTHLNGPGYYSVRCRVWRGLRFASSLLPSHQFIRDVDFSNVENAFLFEESGDVEKKTMSSFRVYATPEVKGLTTVEIDSTTNTRVKRSLAAPGRITDLRVVSMSVVRRTVVLVWTAPGGDLDSGVASTYVLKYSSVYAALTSSRFDADNSSVDVSHHLSSPRPVGRREQVVVTVSSSVVRRNKFFFAMKAVDADGNTSPVSNVAQIYFRKLPHLRDRSQHLYKTKGIIIAVIVVVVCVVVAVMLILLLPRRQTLFQPRESTYERRPTKI